MSGTGAQRARRDPGFCLALPSAFPSLSLILLVCTMTDTHSDSRRPCESDGTGVTSKLSVPRACQEHGDPKSDPNTSATLAGGLGVMPSAFFPHTQVRTHVLWLPWVPVALSGLLHVTPFSLTQKSTQVQGPGQSLGPSWHRTGCPERLADQQNQDPNEQIQIQMSLLRYQS